MGKKIEHLIVRVDNAKEKRSLLEFLHARGLGSKPLTVEETEDLGLAMMLAEVDQTKKVSRETIMRKLKR